MNDWRTAAAQDSNVTRLFCYTLSAESEEQMRIWPFVLLCVVGMSAGVSAAQNKSGGSKQLHDLFTAGWDYDMEQNPESASEMGDRRWNTAWEDMSPEAYARRNQHNQEVLAI